MDREGGILSSGCAEEAHHTYRQGGFEDLSELLGTTWDEEMVLDNFRLRFLSEKPYTNSGRVLVAVNPCRNLVDLYDRDMQVRHYFARNTWRKHLPASWHMTFEGATSFYFHR